MRRHDVPAIGGDANRPQGDGTADTVNERLGALGIARQIYERAGRRVAHTLFEAGHHDTSAAAGAQIQSPAPAPYQPSGWLFITRALWRTPVHVDDVFVDFGSGMGRVVCQAARHFPFRRVIGIEVDELLACVARDNVRRLESRRAAQIDLITADARTWQVPDDVTHAYFYNPFGARIMRSVIEQLLASLDRRPRELTIIYANPVHADVITDTGRFELVRTSRGARRTRDRTICVYRSDGP